MCWLFSGFGSQFFIVSYTSKIHLKRLYAAPAAPAALAPSLSWGMPIFFKTAIFSGVL
jgi:hypothetical protein